MPELPDIAAYSAALEERILGRTLEHVRLASVFVLRTVDPPVSAVEGKPAIELMPQKIRTAGLSLAYSVATATFGGFTPAVANRMVRCASWA